MWLYCLFVLAAVPPATGSMHGLAMVHNGPVLSKLVSIEPTTGNVTLVGPAHAELAAAGDLGTIDAKRGIYYYLGDTSAGATVVGIKLSDGSELCRATVPLRVIGFVGIGQSLDFNPKTDDLILSGLAESGNMSALAHTILSGPSANCGPFKTVGSFPEAEFSPMIHSSTLDVASQTLFVLVAPTKQTIGIAIIDLEKGTMTKVDVEATADEALDAINFDAATNSLFGVWQASPSGLVLQRLNVATGAWTSTPIRSPFGYIGGNLGTVRAYDAATGSLYVLVCNPPKDPNADPVLHLANVDIRTNTVGNSPTLQYDGTSPFGPGVAPFIEQLAWSS